MLERRAVAAGVVVVCATAASVLLGGGAEAGASRPYRDPGRASEGRPLRDHADDASGHTEHHAGRPHEATLPGTAPGTQDGDAPGGEDGALGTESTPTEPTLIGPTLIGTVSGGGGPTVGGAPATTQGAADTEALVAATAPTPPKGAEPAAAGSPGAVVPPDGAEVPAAPLPVADAPALSDLLGSAIGATDPRPAAYGLSPDTARSGALVAIFAFVVSLFLVAHQLVDRRDPRRRAARVAEAVARFR